MSPTDKDCYFGLPYFDTPKYDEIHISVCFTWDTPKAQELAKQWEGYGKIKIGGVAINGESKKPFQAGIYLRKGITITSRGCPNHCDFCLVRKDLIEFNEFPQGNIIQDNNILACSDRHWRLVLSMLRKEKAIEFKGGLEKYRITPKIAEDLRGLHIKTIWLACDQPNALEPLKKAVEILKKVGFTRNHLYCYVLIGKDINEEEQRLRQIWNIGCMPFAQLFRNKNDDIKYSYDFRRFARAWSKPAIIRSRSKNNWCQWI